MGLRSPTVPFSKMDQRQSDQYARNVPVTPDTDSTGSEQIKDRAVTEPKFADGAVSTRATANKAITPQKLSDANALTVFGNPLATNGTRADIALDADGKFIVRRGNQVVGDTIQDGDIAASIARVTDVSSAITAHEAALDPHPQYQTESEGDARYAQLDVENTFTANQTLNASVNDNLEIDIDNDSNGTNAAARIAINSGDASGSLFVTGSGSAVTVVDDGPIGAQMCLRTLDSHPLVFGTDNTYRGQIDGAGFWFIDGLLNAVDDTAAAGAGVPVGALYRNGSVVMIRVS